MLPFHVCKHIRDDFPDLVSYNCFIEVMKSALLQQVAYLKAQYLGKFTGKSFFDELKNICQIESILHRSSEGLIVKQISGLMAYFNLLKKPSPNLEVVDQSLVLCY